MSHQTASITSVIISLMNPVLAVIFTVAMGMLLSGTISFLILLIAIPFAGIRYIFPAEFKKRPD